MRWLCHTFGCYRGVFGLLPISLHVFSAAASSAWNYLKPDFRSAYSLTFRSFFNPSIINPLIEGPKCMLAAWISPPLHYACRHQFFSCDFPRQERQTDRRLCFLLWMQPAWSHVYTQSGYCVMLCSVVVAREKITAIVTSMKTLCLRDILWNRLLWSDVSDEYEARRRRRTGDEEFRDPVSDSLLVKTEHYSTRSCFHEFSLMCSVQIYLSSCV